jgi:homoserine kinase
MKATVFAPGSIGNVGPGFDVLGLAFDGLGDRVTVELTDGDPRVATVSGRDAELVPRDPDRNVASIAAAAWLREAKVRKNAIVSIEKGLPLAGGMGGSAASSVGGAYAASVAAGMKPDSEAIMRAALQAESTVSGRHLDNIAPCVVGGLALVRSAEPIDVIAIPTPERWAVVLLTPHVRIETRAARAILPEEWSQSSWIQQMANTAAMTYGFATGDGALVRRALDDLFAEPVRAPMIPNFAAVKRAALDAGSFGCSISGSGPTIFAVTSDLDDRCAAAMKAAMRDTPCDVHVTRIARQGVRVV